MTALTPADELAALARALARPAAARPGLGRASWTRRAAAGFPRPPRRRRGSGPARAVRRPLSLARRPPRRARRAPSSAVHLIADDSIGSRRRRLGGGSSAGGGRRRRRRPTARARQPARRERRAAPAARASRRAPQRRRGRERRAPRSPATLAHARRRRPREVERRRDRAIARRRHARRLRRHLDVDSDGDAGERDARRCGSRPRSSTTALAAAVAARQRARAHAGRPQTSPPSASAREAAVRDARAEREGLLRRARQRADDRRGAVTACARRLRPLDAPRSHGAAPGRRARPRTGAAYATVAVELVADARAGGAARRRRRAGRPATRCATRARARGRSPGVLLIALGDRCSRSALLGALAALAARMLGPPAARAGARRGLSKRLRGRGRLPVDVTGERTRDRASCSPGCRCSRRWAPTTSSASPRSPSRAASPRARSSSARATTPTRATSSAPATRARVREHADGRQITLATFGPGDIFGELAMFDDERRSATVEAIDDLEALGDPRRRHAPADAAPPGASRSSS